MYYPVQLAGGTYRHTDLTLSAQQTVNFWPQRQDGPAKNNYILESFYGLASFSSGNGADRGLFQHLGSLYQLRDTTLESIDSAGARTSLGTVAGTTRAVFAAVGTTIVIATEGVAYTWNGSSLTTASDPDFETPQTVTSINNQAIYDGDTDRFAVSDVGAPLTIDALNYGSAQFRPDTMVRPYAFGTNVYMFCEQHFETWWNDPNATNPPFSRIEGASVNIGLAARHSVAEDDRNVYFFGSDDQVYALTGSVVTPLLPKVLVRTIRGFSTKSDAIGWTMHIDGQWFYVLKFKTADKTFIYPRGGEWFELSSGVAGGRYSGNSYAYAFGKHLIADENGNILEMDTDTYEEAGSPIRRVRVMDPIHGAQFGKPGAEVEISFLRLIGKTGTGILTGQGSDPEIILQWSSNGYDYNTEQRGKIGQMGEFTEIIFEVNDAKDIWYFRLIQTDPVYANWHSAGIEANLGMI